MVLNRKNVKIQERKEADSFWQAGQYTPLHQFWKKVNRFFIVIALLIGGTIGLKWTKYLFILAILYKSLHIVLGSEGSDETGWKPGLLIFSSQVINGLFLEEIDGVRWGPKEIKSQTRTILETINRLYSI